MSRRLETWSLFATSVHSRALISLSDELDGLVLLVGFKLLVAKVSSASLSTARPCSLFSTPSRPHLRPGCILPHVVHRELETLLDRQGDKRNWTDRLRKTRFYFSVTHCILLAHGLIWLRKRCNSLHSLNILCSSLPSAYSITALRQIQQQQHRCREKIMLAS